jgi:ribosomal protein S18 acetylase RimI-like enzyme
MAQEILININVSSGKAEAGLNKTSKSVSKLEAAQNKLNYELSEEAKELAKVNAAIKQQQIANKNAAFSNLQYGNSFSKLGGKQKQFRTQAGLNNAILLETGRLASDASFGFTAIANNLSQLTSLFGSFVSTTGSVTESIKQLGKSILGTGGVLLAVQLVIGALQSKEFLDFLQSLNGITDAMKALRKASDEATDVFGKQIGKLNTLTRLLEDNRITQSQRSMVLKELKKDHKDLNIELDEEGRLTDETTRAINRKIDVLKVQAETQALVTAIQEETVKQLKEENKTAVDNINLFESIILLTKNYGNFSKAAVEGVKEGESDRQEAIAESQETIDALYERLTQVVNFETRQEDGRGGRSNRFRVFREGLLQLQKIEESYRRRAIDQDLLTEEEKIENQRQFNTKDLELSVSNFEEKELVRLNAYVKQLKERKLSSEKEQELIDQANLAFIKSIEKAEDDAAKVRVQINALAVQQLDDLSDKRRDKAIDNIAKIRESERLLAITRETLAQKESFLDADYIGRLEFPRKEIDLIVEQTNAEGLRLNSIKENNAQEIALQEEKLASAAEGSSQEALALQNLSELKLQSVSIEENLTKNQAKNSDARIRIAKAEANAKVQAFEVTAQALTAFSKLAGEDTKAGKALAVSGALISTYLSAQKAFESQFKPLPTPDSPVRGAIAAAAAVASGVANVKAILSVDEKGSTSLAAQPPKVQAPAFNVVGASAANQLAGAVSGQLQQPVKAFVVGKEITSQQELDREIINTAGI